MHLTSLYCADVGAHQLSYKTDGGVSIVAGIVNGK